MTAYKQSVGATTEQVFTKIFRTDFNTAWQSVLEALKSSRLDVANRESGFIQTRWLDNTSQKNFADSFGGADSYLKAQYRFKIVVSKGFFEGKESVKVAVEREQMIQRDVLEGWVPTETDTIEENTLLYRIGRIIFVNTKIARLEKEKLEKEIESSGF